ncbi:MAG TPA: helix-turn-helix domain-containing protein [Pseudonocardia sp.]|jgi:AcrR family transcriptional regulator
MAAELGTEDQVSRPASRRSSPEVRRLILDAARALFAERGFGGAGTRDIAEAAGVTQAAIFRHFGTKEGLFEAAVAEPFETCITTFLDRWERHEPGSRSNPELVRSFMRLFHATLQQNRALFLAYFMAPTITSARTGESVLSQQLDAIARRMQREADRRGFVAADIPVAVRCAAGIVLSIALHGEVLFPPGPLRPDYDRMLDEMVLFSLAGIERSAGQP